jgi:hypothetical protein
MATTSRSVPLPYVPGASVSPAASVGDLSRATWDELFKISQALIELDRPAASVVACSEPVNITPTTIYDRLFDENDIYEWEAPGGQTDSTTGIWTCPQEGLYLFTGVIEIPAFPTPATKEYTATLRTTLIPINGGAPLQILSTAGGLDNMPLRINPNIARPLNRGDTVYQDLDITHHTVSGVITVTAVRNIIRQSGIK